ncbi:MAG TPA: 3'-5' exonuclease [Leucothrix sp.]|nr:3'-5' exonuclease [Leucothrix sp.]
MNVLVFDIETIPDIQSGQKIFDLEGLDDASTVKAMRHLRQQHADTDFMPLHLHQIVAISVLYRGMSDDMGHEVSVRSLGEPVSSEAELLELFINEIETHTPTLVSWNGSGFDLPVIHYRMLKNNISAPNYWEKGDNNSAFRYDNYLGRYYESHTDLMNVLASYNSDARAPLDHIATMLGFPGQMRMDGSFFTANGSVWDQYQAANIKKIRNSCETDVLNTYLVYLRFQLMRGELNNDELEQEYILLREILDSSGKEHLQQFSKSWG